MAFRIGDNAVGDHTTVVVTGINVNDGIRSDDMTDFRSLRTCIHKVCIREVPDERHTAAVFDVAARRMVHILIKPLSHILAVSVFIDNGADSGQ